MRITTMPVKEAFLGMEIRYNGQIVGRVVAIDAENRVSIVVDNKCENEIMALIRHPKSISMEVRKK